MAFKAIPATLPDPPRHGRGEAVQRAASEAATSMFKMMRNVAAHSASIDAEAAKLRSRVTEREGRSSEKAIAVGVMRLLAESDEGEASIQEVLQRLPRFASLTAADQVTSSTRPGEPVWAQQVRNIISHRGAPGNAIHEGLLAYIAPGKLRITAEGRELARRAASDAEGSDRISSRSAKWGD